MRLIKNKKAFFFSFITFIIVIVLLASYLVVYNKTYKQKTDNDINNVITMNNFLNDIKEDSKRALYIGSYRAILAIQDNIITSGNYVDDFKYRFKELILNGTLYNETSFHMNDSTLINWSNRIENRIPFNTRINILKVDVSQNNPWFVHVNMTFRVLMSSDYASFNTSFFVKNNIPIIGFEDPIYVINTNNYLTNLFEISPYSAFVTPINNTYNLTQEINNSYYYPSTQAPSFIDRYEGKITSQSPYGIESFVNLERLQDKGIPIKYKSNLDYIYFSSLDPQYCKVYYIPYENFRINNDTQTLQRYNVYNLIYDCVG